MNLHLTKETAARICQATQANKDGSLSYKEFVLAFDPPSDRGPPLADKPTPASSPAKVCKQPLGTPGICCTDPGGLSDVICQELQLRLIKITVRSPSIMSDLSQSVYVFTFKPPPPRSAAAGYQLRQK
jgi:hypothetical protein